MSAKTSPTPGIRPLFAAFLLSGVLWWAATPAALASPTLLWSFHGNGSLQAIAAVPDIDGDGGPDIVFEGYENGPSGVNHVFAIRGRSSGNGQVLWAADPQGGASSGGGWGDNCLRRGPDLNGDGFPEVLLGTAWGGRTAFALNGKTGGAVWSFDTYAHYGDTYSGWIYAMDSLGSDLTGDGVPEVVFCSGSYNDRIHCVNGATGVQVWVYNGGDAFFDVRSCQDINGDGIRDVVALLGDDNLPFQVVALSGANGSLLWSRPVQNSVWNIAFINDINGDGISEIVPAQWGSNLYCISGKTGAVLWSQPIGAQQRVVTLDDVNGDGIQDIAVGFNTASACRVVSGANGSTLWNTPTSNWTWAVDRVGDCNGDGINDVAVGDFNGRVYLLDGVDGHVLWSWLNPTGDKIMTIRGVGDLNGNGEPDIVAGTQLLYGGTGGYVYALEGNDTPVSVPSGPLPAAGLAVGESSPNPSAGSVEWSVRGGPAGDGAAGDLRVVICDAGGRLVRELRASVPPAGGVLGWDGRDEHGQIVGGGIYLAKVLQDGHQVAERKIVRVP